MMVSLSMVNLSKQLVNKGEEISLHLQKEYDLMPYHVYSLKEEIFLNCLIKGCLLTIGITDIEINAIITKDGLFICSDIIENNNFEHIIGLL